MNAKEQIIDILQEYEHGYKDLLKRSGLFPREIEIANKRILEMQHLITAVENAIFDVPSEDLIEHVYNVHTANECRDMDIDRFKDAVKEILNYKKPESDEK